MIVPKDIDIRIKKQIFIDKNHDMQKLFGVCPSSVLYTSKMRKHQVYIYLQV